MSADSEHVNVGYEVPDCLESETLGNADAKRCDRRAVDLALDMDRFTLAAVAAGSTCPPRPVATMLADAPTSPGSVTANRLPWP